LAKLERRETDAELVGTGEPAKKRSGKIGKDGGKDNMMKRVHLLKTAPKKKQITPQGDDARTTMNCLD
jgi:hypothetical protein